MTRSAVVLAALLAAGSAAAAGATQHPGSVWTGVYTDAQAADGEKVYRATCESCHGADLAGIEQAPPLAGGPFGQRWDGATLKKLYDQVVEMPDDAPKSLTSRQYGDVLAFILRANGIPSGADRLDPDHTPLADIVFTPVKPK
jgi:cytochrome c5